MSRFETDPPVEFDLRLVSLPTLRRWGVPKSQPLKRHEVPLRRPAERWQGFSDFKACGQSLYVRSHYRAAEKCWGYLRRRGTQSSVQTGE